MRACSWNDHGMTCPDYGIMSTETHGKGPWYCRKHFAALMRWPAWMATQPADSMKEVDARVNTLVPRREGESEHDWSMRCKDWTLAKLRGGPRHKPGREWAGKILAREAAGELLPIASLEMAREALSGRPEMPTKATERHPGDDEDQTSVVGDTEGSGRVLGDPGAFEGWVEFSTVQDPKSWDVDRDTGEIRNIDNGEDECPV